jgi:hypothetical protein
MCMDDLGEYKQLYPGTKKVHFKKIHEESGVDYTDMVCALPFLFFLSRVVAALCLILHTHVRVCVCVCMCVCVFGRGGHHTSIHSKL